MSDVGDVVTWAETNWIIPESKRPIRLREWQKAALHAMFPSDGTAPRHETFLISAPKKSGKTTLNALATCYAALTFPAPETAYVVANDQDQAVGRVFVLISDAVRTMRMPNVKITATEIKFPTGSKIVAIPADFAGAAGAIFGISSWTELWAFR